MGVRRGIFVVIEGEDCPTLAGQGVPGPVPMAIHPHRCWFHEKTADSALYVTVHGYFLITYLFSAVVLGLVAWKIFTLSSAMAGKERRQKWKGVLTLLGLSSLVGMTWGLAILTPLGLSTIYIFAVLNSLQGEAPGWGGGGLPRLHQRVLGVGEGVVCKKEDSSGTCSSQRY